MRLTGRLTAQEVMQLRRILWAPHYRLNLFNNYTMATGHFLPLMVGVGCGAGVASWIVTRTHWNPVAVGGAFGTIGIMLLCSLLVRWHHVPARLLRSINANAPEYIDLDDHGLALKQADGTKLSIPWQVPKGWRCGSQAAIVDFAETNRMTPIPLAGLTSVEKKEVFDTLRRHLGQPDFFLPGGELDEQL